MPTLRPAALILSTLALALATSACNCPAKYELSKEAQLAMLKDEGYYAEEQRDGRIYVFGAKKSHEAFKAGAGLEVSKRFIGAGPGGETVILEAKDKLPEMTARLIATFSKNHGISLE